jgi:hypothetical protein
MRKRGIAAMVVGCALTVAAAPGLAADVARKTAPVIAAHVAGSHVVKSLQKLDIEALKTGLRKVRGVGLFTKLDLASRVNRFTEDFYWFHKGNSGRSLAEMRARFDRLHARIAHVLDGKDEGMHAMLVRSRDALWRAYADRRLFAAGVGRKVIERIEGGGQLAFQSSR